MTQMIENHQKALEKAATSYVTVYAVEDQAGCNIIGISEKRKEGPADPIRAKEALSLGLDLLCKAAKNEKKLRKEEAESIKKITVFLKYLFSDSVFSNPKQKNDRK